MSSEMDTSGARFFPKMDLTQNDDDTGFHVFDIPASAIIVALGRVTSQDRDVALL